MKLNTLTQLLTGAALAATLYMPQSAGSANQQTELGRTTRPTIEQTSMEAIKQAYEASDKKWNDAALSSDAVQCRADDATQTTTTARAQDATIDHAVQFTPSITPTINGEQKEYHTTQAIIQYNGPNNLEIALLTNPKVGEEICYENMARELAGPRIIKTVQTSEYILQRITVMDEKTRRELESTGEIGERETPQIYSMTKIRVIGTTRQGTQRPFEIIRSLQSEPITICIGPDSEDNTPYQQRECDAAEGLYKQVAGEFGTPVTATFGAGRAAAYESALKAAEALKNQND